VGLLNALPGTVQLAELPQDQYIFWMLLLYVGAGGAFTVITNVADATAPVLAVAVYVTVYVPVELGVPLNIRVEALKLTPGGIPLALYVMEALFASVALGAV
jgi:hypothetical protein